MAAMRVPSSSAPTADSSVSDDRGAEPLDEDVEVVEDDVHVTARALRSARRAG